MKKKKLNWIICIMAASTFIFYGAHLFGQEKVVLKKIKAEVDKGGNEKVVDAFEWNGKAKFGNVRMARGFYLPQGNRNFNQRNFLNLSDEQKEKMKAIKLKSSKELLPIRNELKEKKAHLHTLSTAENANLRSINKVIDEIAELMAKQMKVRASSRQEMRTLLTEEQRIKFDTMKEYLGGRMKVNAWQQKRRAAHPKLNSVRIN